MTAQSQTFPWACYLIIRLCCVLDRLCSEQDTAESDFALSMTLQCRLHWTWHPRSPTWKYVFGSNSFFFQGSWWVCFINIWGEKFCKVLRDFPAFVFLFGNHSSSPKKSFTFLLWYNLKYLTIANTVIPPAVCQFFFITSYLMIYAISRT